MFEPTKVRFFFQSEYLAMLFSKISSVLYIFAENFLANNDCEL